MTAHLLQAIPFIFSIGDDGDDDDMEEKMMMIWKIWIWKRYGKEDNDEKVPCKECISGRERSLMIIIQYIQPTKDAASDE